MNHLYIKLPNKRKAVIIRAYPAGNFNLAGGKAGVKVSVKRKNKSPLIKIFFKHELP